MCIESCLTVKYFSCRQNGRDSALSFWKRKRQDLPASLRRKFLMMRMRAGACSFRSKKMQAFGRKPFRRFWIAVALLPTRTDCAPLTFGKPPERYRRCTRAERTNCAMRRAITSEPTLAPRRSLCGMDEPFDSEW